MAGFSIAEVAFTGVRLIRERPKAFGVWVVVLLVFGQVVTVGMIVLAGPQLSALRTDPAAAASALGRATPIYLFNLLFYPVAYGAMNRAVLEPENSAFGYIRLGKDELRQLGLMLLYIAVMAAAYLVIGLGGLILSTMASLVLSALLGASAAVILGVLALVMVFGGLSIVATRLCLASPLTFATKRIDLFGSWKLTDGYFWSLFAVGLIALFLTLIGVALAFGLCAALSIVPGAGLQLDSLIHPDMTSLGAYFSPGRIVLIVVLVGVEAALLPLWLAAPAAAYRAMTGGASHVREVQEIFS